MSCWISSPDDVTWDVIGHHAASANHHPASNSCPWEDDAPKADVDIMPNADLHRDWVALPSLDRAVGDQVGFASNDTPVANLDAARALRWVNAADDDGVRPNLISSLDKILCAHFIGRKLDISSLVSISPFQ